MRRLTLAVLALALLLMIALSLHRAPRDQKPGSSPRRPGVPEPSTVYDAVAKGVFPSESPLIAAAVPDRIAPTPVSAAGMESIRGVVRLNGPIPKRKTYRTDDDPKCEAIHGPQIVLDEFVVDPYGNIQWASVYIRSGIGGPVPPAPTPPVLLDPVACVVTPHVSDVRVGQPLVIVNSDELLRNVHALPSVNKEFNIGLPRGRQEYSRVGSYVIRDVPAGSYEVEAWHERCRRVATPIVVAPGRGTVLDFVLDEQKE
jgi:hypothetical protein